MKNLEKNITSLYGEAGKAWLDRLPAISRAIAADQALSDLQPLRGLSYNYLFTAQDKRSGNPVVIKVGFSADEITREAAALTHFAGAGCVRLLRSVPQHNALLLQALQPGHTLKSLYPASDPDAVDACLQMMKQIYARPCPQQHSFPSVAEWLEAFAHVPAQALPGSMLAKAQALAKELLADSTDEVVLHGDLHHENCLNHAGSWLCIDPKGVVGDCAFEVGAFLINPVGVVLEHPDLRGLTCRRLEQFAAGLNMDMKRLAAWSFVRVMLAAAWSVHCKSDPQAAIAVAQCIPLSE